jgi:hypothetical protein
MASFGIRSTESLGSIVREFVMSNKLQLELTELKIKYRVVTKSQYISVKTFSKVSLVLLT